MADDLNLPVEVVGCPIVREPDGLAMSSRNAYLVAPISDAPRSCCRARCGGAADAIVAGERDAARDRASSCASWSRREPRVALEYVEVRDAHDLTPMTVLDGTVLVAVAARVGETRLIDNVVVAGRRRRSDRRPRCREHGRA